ncbi:MAG: hypothetical protein QF436_02015 [Candidatus Woesearchaeota archaeon]|jgi:hypothetical protein|nr:hypothetical protein [Candidatus Woesearchaeota archaeon]MDP7622867.1 hypothetical protein [Candidatus Woesearchaeota archaeon]HJN56873.1 hypothetical protein [Candidatus Woesearchaeota archaeon]|tara:strand:+ start:20662 stop:21366 length:705 start_codon:yes stop_codon:yes gene_type:complete
MVDCDITLYLYNKQANPPPIIRTVEKTIGNNPLESLIVQDQITKEFSKGDPLYNAYNALLHKHLDNTVKVSTVQKNIAHRFENRETNNQPNNDIITIIEDWYFTKIEGNKQSKYGIVEVYERIENTEETYKTPTGIIIPGIKSINLPTIIYNFCSRQNGPDTIIEDFSGHYDILADEIFNGDLKQYTDDFIKPQDKPPGKQKKPKKKKEQRRRLRLFKDADLAMYQKRKQQFKS